MTFYALRCGWLVKLDIKSPRRISSTPFSVVERKQTEEKGKREKWRVLLGETDNNYTCPRRPREPDHVAMETQVQQKVTGKSIQIELIAHSLSLSRLISQGLQSTFPL